jgi:hypothetical protein
MEQKLNEENLSTLQKKEKEDPRIFCPESVPRRPQRYQKPPEEGPEKISRQLKR